MDVGARRKTAKINMTPNPFHKLDRPYVSEYSLKRYRCRYCQFEFNLTTNHYGDIYVHCHNSRCPSWLPSTNSRHRPPIHECIDPLPKGTKIRGTWKRLTLGFMGEFVSHNMLRSLMIFLILFGSWSFFMFWLGLAQ